MKAALWILAISVLLVGCHNDMWLQPKVEAQDESEFFGDGKAGRPPVEGTVAFGDTEYNEGWETGYVNGELVETAPVPVTREMLELGRERFNIFCSHCHGFAGDGEGMIAKRGLALAQPPASYHTDRLRNLPDGHIFDVITNGYGVMFSQAARIPEEERWAIVLYVRVLQRSQGASFGDVPPQYREELGISAEEQLERLEEGAHETTRTMNEGGEH